MSAGTEPPPEHEIVSARMRGGLSIDASYERLYRIYAPVVTGWLIVRVEPGATEDLSQDVWTVFYRRWQNWEQPAEMNTPAARPVLSFLFRTVHLATLAHRRCRRGFEPLDGIDVPDHRAAPERLMKRIAAARCLELARQHSTTEEVAILTGKMAGVPAREIARTLGITEATVDHRYRNTLERLRRRLESGPEPTPERAKVC